ncbi:hypothetical protein CR64_28855, partial [Pseudomonas aeruginosa]
MSSISPGPRRAAVAACRRAFRREAGDVPVAPLEERHLGAERRQLGAIDSRLLGGLEGASGILQAALFEGDAPGQQMQVGR